MKRRQRSGRLLGAGAHLNRQEHDCRQIVEAVHKSHAVQQKAYDGVTKDELGCTSNICFSCQQAMHGGLGIVVRGPWNHVNYAGCSSTESIRAVQPLVEGTLRLNLIINGESSRKGDPYGGSFSRTLGVPPFGPIATCEKRAKQK